MALTARCHVTGGSPQLRVKVRRLIERSMVALGWDSTTYAAIVRRIEGVPDHVQATADDHGITVRVDLVNGKERQLGWVLAEEVGTYSYVPMPASRTTANS